MGPGETDAYWGATNVGGTELMHTGLWFTCKVSFSGGTFSVSVIPSVRSALTTTSTGTSFSFLPRTTVLVQVCVQTVASKPSWGGGVPTSFSQVAIASVIKSLFSAVRATNVPFKN